MGVCGCGKTTIGAMLAKKTRGIFIDGDQFHPEQNVAKMSAGLPLDDDDRKDWLVAIRTTADKHPGPWPLLIGCSSLKRKYRNLFRRGKHGARFCFIHLSGSPSLIQERMEQRSGHFMKAGMLDSQFADLETLAVDEAGLTVDITPSPEEIVEKILAWLADNSSTTTNS
ncbi:MAG: gluconokinase [Verrucomicrobiaceae bacterium]|nr:gluconokinase [Verrucomicrobiaceae bacterium]